MSRVKIIGVLSFIVFVAFYVSCSSDNSSNPEETQKNGGIKGRIVLEDLSDLGRIKVSIVVKDTSFSTIANKDGTFQLNDIPTGTYTLRIISDDPRYKEVEISNVNVQPGNITDLGDINISIKGGVIKGVVIKRDREGNKSVVDNVDVYVLSRGKISGIVSNISLEDRCVGVDTKSGLYSGKTGSNGHFEIRVYEAGIKYIVNTVDEIKGLGYSGDVELVKDGDLVDVGEVEMIDPSFLIQVKDEEGRGIIEVTSSNKVMLVYQMTGLLQEVKLVEGENLDNVEWRAVNGYGSDIVELSAGDGEKLFSVKFRDLFCRETPVYKAKIYRDITKPELKDVSVTGASKGRDGKWYVNDKKITLKVLVYDRYHTEYKKDTSGMVIKFGEGDLSGINYEAYTGENYEYTLSEGEGDKEVGILVRDEAGNESELYKLPIHYGP